MESGHGSKPISDLKTHLATTVDEGDLSTPGKELGSSSSSSFSDSSSEDLFQDDENEPSKSTPGTTGLYKLAEDAQLASKNGEKDVPKGSNPNYEQFNYDPPVSTLSSSTQSPPVQTMERSSDPASYRIPSSVFTRTKSTTPMEWSLASNESLFSIHMGNMSFTRDHLLLMGKSGELVKPGEPTTSSQLMNFSSNHPPVYRATSTTNLDQGLGVTEAAAETMKEVLRANEEDRSKEKLSLANGAPHSASISQISDESGNSVTSFAFPILTGDGDKGDSLNVRSEQHQHQHQQDPPPQPETPAANPVARTYWFSCFSRCPFCS